MLEQELVCDLDSWLTAQRFGEVVVIVRSTTTTVPTSRIVNGLLSAAWAAERLTTLGVLVIEVSLAAGSLGEWPGLVDAEG